MKKNKILLLMASLLTVLFIAPTHANADTVNVYFFRSSSCPHCQEAQAFFKELQEGEEYKDLFVLRDFEVSSKKNSNLMSEAAEIMGDNATGVPYIVIGEESFMGYSSSSDENIKNAIKETYENEEFVDPLASLMSDAENGSNDGLIIVGILVGVIAVVGVGIFFARKDTDKIEEAIEKEEKKEEIKKVEEKPVTKNEGKTSTKKSTTKKASTSKTSTKKTTTAKKTTTKKKTTKK